MKKLVLALGALAALTACSDEQSVSMTDVKSLAPKIMMDVQTINLADRSGMQPLNSPYTRNHFTPTIDEAIKQWATDHMQAAGQMGRAIVIIKDASLTAEPLPMQEGIDSWFKRQQGLKYIGHADVSIEARGRDGYAMTEATATRSISLPEDPTDSERQDAYYKLITGLMKDLDASLQTGIHEHMNKFIITAPVYGSTAVPEAMPSAAAAAPVADTVPAAMATAPAVPTLAPTAVTVPAAAPMAAPAAPTANVVIPLSQPAGN